MKSKNQNTEVQSNHLNDDASKTFKDELNIAISLDPELRKSVSSDVVERLSKNSKLIRSLVRTENFTGPFPPPDILEKYNKVLPGAAERIFSLTECEQQHRHSIQNKAINGALKKDLRGQWMGFSITVLVLFIACYFAYIGSNAFATVLVTIDLVALAAVFVIGHRAKSLKEIKDNPK